MIYVGNQTIAYPFGWRNDKWLQNVLDIPTGKPVLDQQAQGCSPNECKDQTTVQSRMKDYGNDYDSYAAFDYDKHQAVPNHVKNQVPYNTFT